MPCTDFVADFLTVLRNASKAHKDKVTLPASKLTSRVAEILKEEGFVESIKIFTEGDRKFIRVHLKYLRNGRPAIQGIKRISKPGLRVYRGVEKLPRVQGGLGIAVLSTSKGVLTDRQARKELIGGEIVCTVW